MNPESLDSSIQSALSALFPPFEVTAPTVLSQLFRLIEERYSSDALQCLLDFLIPSKHLLESIQQAACAGYSDVVFRCEGWPLCLHDKTVIQLAPVNPLLLRPGDFYLQVEPFADQAVRIVLKSLLEEGCREVEETPIPETSYPCMFTEEWLQDLNEGRHGTPLSCCLLCTDHGVVKLPWAKIAIPEFLDKPKITPMYQEITPQTKQTSVPSHFNSSTLPVEAICHPSKERMSASLRPVDCGFRRIPKSRSKPLIKPVGWVSPNNWDSPEMRQEIEGDYVDLVDITKRQGKGTDKQSDEWLQTSVLKALRPPSPVLCGNGAPCACTLQYAEETGHELTDHHLKCSYRDSYVAALRNRVAFKKGSVNHLAALGEVGLPDVALPSKSMSRAKNDQLENVCNHFNEPSNNELQQYRHSSQTRRDSIEEHVESESLMEDPPVVLNSRPGLRHSEKVTMKLISKQPDPNAGVTLDVFLENKKPHRTAEAEKPPGKQHVKVRSLSTVSETSKGSTCLYELSSQSYSDVCPDMISSVMQLKKGELLGQTSRKLEGRNSLRKDLLSSRSESPVDGPVSKLHNSKTERLSSSLQNFETQNSSQSGQPSFRSISGLLELGIICLPGSRDRTGRSVVEVHGDRKEWMSPLVSAQNVCELLLYLHSIPRKEIRELGMTLVINARKKATPLHFYKALLMAQEQALHAVHSIVTLVDKDTCPRPEKYPGLQMDLVTSMKALNKTVDTSQLTSDLGGSFTYSHADWLQFHQRLVSFMADLREADSLLQKAIKKVDERSKLDTVQEVQQCIEEQKCSMKEVLEDARLVTLQREGGAVLARMRREDFRFPQSEDYRDALESVTVLYNQVEEKLHTLVMRSNESLQHLDFLFRLRKMESKISTVGMWLNSEGEQMLKDSHTADSLVCAEKALHHYDLFLTQAKEKQRYALNLVTEAEEIVGLGYSGPATDIFGTLVRTFKSDIDEFMLRAEQKHKEMETLLHVHSFCEQACALAKECSHFLEKVEQRCYSALTQSALQMYEERLGGEFSTLNFQAVKAKACAVGSGAAGAMKVWNAAWVQCQQHRQHLDKMQKNKTFLGKELIQQTTAEHPRPEDGGVEKTEKGSEAQQQNWHREDVKICEHEGGESTIGTSLHQYLQPDLTGNAPHATIQEAVFPQTNGRPREHHSEADLRTVDPAGEDGGFPARQHLGRSLSEGSHAGFQLPSSFLPLNVRNKHCQSRTQPLQLNLHPIHKQIGCLNDSYGSRHLRSKRDGKDEYCEGCTGSSEVPQHLTPETSVRAIGNSSNNVKLQKIMEELLTTEREYVSALGYVREHYFPELERANVPQDLRGQRGIIFGNLEKLHDFHQHHFLSELENCVNEPFRVGRCFLRHKESFALYALYSKNKPQSDALFISHGQSFFKQMQMKLGDKMDLWSYLLKPVQRISKYSLLLQDMMVECGPRQTREIAEVKAALEVIHFQLRHGNNLLAMDAIQQCDVNLKEQGQLIRQDEFLVTFRKKKCFRHIFLFQELVLFSKTRKTEVGNDTYLYKQSFKTTDIGLTQNSGDTGLCFEIWFRKRKTQDTYTLQAVSPVVKEAWTRDLERILWEQAVHNREIRMQERVFMGIGNKPFMDIQPSDAAISNRAVNCVLIGRDIKLLCSAGSSRGLEDGLPGGRPKSLGSGSSSSSSSSSGISSLSPVGYLCGPTNRVGSGGSGGYVSPPGALEEDDLDHGGVVHNLLLNSSESSGESVSGFSSSSHSFHSAIGGEADDMGSVCSSTATVKEALFVHGAEGSVGHLRTSEEPLPSVLPGPKPQDLPCDKAQSTNVRKSTGLTCETRIGRDPRRRQRVV